MHINKYLTQIHEKGKDFRLYIILCVLRFVLVFLPQNGYVHPDEFFQSVEVMAGDEYGLEHTRTWEFNVTAPIRSVALPFIYIKIPLNCLRFLNVYARYFLNINLLTSYTLIVFPRLIITILSFSNDWSMYQICKSYGLKYEKRLVVLASSYCMLIYGTRTFSNTIEMGLCSILLAIVAECMVASNTAIFQTEFLRDKYNAAQTTVERVKFYKLQTAVPSHSFNKCFLIATLCVLGIFNRPTFVLFGMPIVFFWLLRGMGTKSVSFADFHLRIGFLIVCGLPTLISMILVDSLYYSHVSVSELISLDLTINNFVVTPINFIRYNINPENTAQFGVHPKWLHFVINVPLLLSVLGIIAIGSFLMMVYRFIQADYRHLPRAQSIVGLMTSTTFVPILFLSLFNHQEPRFLLPITLPIIMLHAPNLQTGFCATNPFPNRRPLTDWLYKHFLCQNASKTFIQRLWFGSNIFLVLFYGFFHQGGVIQLNRHLANSPQLQDQTLITHLITSHIYKVPMAFFFLPSTKVLITNPNTGVKYRRTKRLYLYEYEEMDMDNLYKHIKLILDVNEMNYGMKKTNQQQRHRHQVLLAIPSSLSNELSATFMRSNNTFIKYNRIKVFYPHISTEAMPMFLKPHPLLMENTNLFNAEQKCSLFDDHHDDIDDDDGQFAWWSTEWLLKQVSSIVHQFGLALYKIEIRKK